MKWPIFAVAVYVLLALQVSLASAMRIDLPVGAIEPRFMLVMLVFVGLSAAPKVVLIAAGAMGLLLDATAVWPTATGEGLTLLGPYGLGYLAGAMVLLQARPMVFRQHPLAYAVMILLAGFAVHLVVMGIFAVRIWYDPIPDFSATQQLFMRGLSLLYSALIGAVLSVPLVAIGPLFGFSSKGTVWQRR